MGLVGARAEVDDHTWYELAKAPDAPNPCGVEGKSRSFHLLSCFFFHFSPLALKGIYHYGIMLEGSRPSYKSVRRFALVIRWVICRVNPFRNTGLAPFHFWEPRTTSSFSGNQQIDQSVVIPM